MTTISELSDGLYSNIDDILNIQYVIPLLNKLLIAHKIGYTKWSKKHSQQGVIKASEYTQIIKNRGLYFIENNGEKTLIENDYMEKQHYSDFKSVQYYIRTIMCFEKYKNSQPMDAYFNTINKKTIINYDLFKCLQMQYIFDQSYFEYTNDNINDIKP